jgi:hypothetical protein
MYVAMFFGEIFFYYDSVIFCYHVSGEVSGEISDESVCEKNVFCYIEEKQDYFLLHRSKSGILGENECVAWRRREILGNYPWGTPSTPHNKRDEGSRLHLVCRISINK